MWVIYFLLGCSLTVAVAFLAAFFSAVRGRQFDDLVTPAHRVLAEESDNNLPNP